MKAKIFLIGLIMTLFYGCKKESNKPDLNQLTINNFTRHIGTFTNTLPNNITDTFYFYRYFYKDSLSFFCDSINVKSNISSFPYNFVDLFGDSAKSFKNNFDYNYDSNNFTKTVNDTLIEFGYICVSGTKVDLLFYGHVLN